MTCVSGCEAGRLQLDDVLVRITHVDGRIAFVLPERKPFACQGVANGVPRAILRTGARMREGLDPDALIASVQPSPHGVQLLRRFAELLD